METEFGKTTSATSYNFSLFWSEAFSEPTLLKVTKQTIRCDLVRGFNHPVRSGLAKGLGIIQWNCHLVRGFTTSC